MRVRFEPETSLTVDNKKNIMEVRVNTEQINIQKTGE